MCDQPNLALSTMLSLIRTAMLHPGKIVCSAHEGMPGNPVLWDRKFFGELLKLEGDTGGKQILERCREQCILVETEAEELKDIDRKQDLAD